MIYFIFILMVTLALSFIILPFPLQFLKSKIIISIILVGVTILGYIEWGGAFAYHHFVQQQKQEKRSKALLQSLKNPDEIIERLKQHLSNSPESAKGWYLLGRVYVSRSKWELAEKAFSKAYSLHPDEEAYAINYIESIWQLNSQKFNQKILLMLKEVLKKNPKQLDALSMLAIAAFQDENYSLAVSYWQRMLAILPENSDEAKSIRKAIAKAYRLRP